VRARRAVEQAEKGEGSALSPLEMVKKHQGAMKLAAYGAFSVLLSFLHAFLMHLSQAHSAHPSFSLTGAFVAAPLDHYLFSLLDRVFSKYSGKRARVLELLASVSLILPVQNAIYLAVLSLIGGAKSAGAVAADVKAGFVEVQKVRLYFTIPLLCSLPPPPPPPTC
jgi:hypothetical protein